jgi:hypothetical protein
MREMGFLEGVHARVLANFPTALRAWHDIRNRRVRHNLETIILATALPIRWHKSRV